MGPVRRRALIVAYCFPPHAAIGTHRTLRLVSHLADTGWDVDVLTARPDAYLPGTPVESSLVERIPANVRVIRSGAFRGFTKLGAWLEPLKHRVRRPASNPAGSGSPAGPAAAPAPGRPGLKATVEELCAMPDKDIGWALPALTQAVRNCSRARPEVIFSSAPPWTTHVVAGRLASFFGCRWVADFRDPWVRSHWTRYRSRPAASLATRLERSVLAKADAIVFTTATARDEYANAYGPAAAERLHVVYNGCDPSELPAAGPSGERFVLLHAGSLYGGRSPLPLLEALASIRRTSVDARRIVLRFLGSTSFPGLDIQRVCQDLGISEAVEFLPRVSRDESLREMQRAAALLILQAGTTMAIPGKLYEYLAAKRPILALCEPGEMAQFIAENRLGVVAAPGDSAGLAGALGDLPAFAVKGYVPADPSLFDGRQRAAELAAILAAATLPGGLGNRAPVEAAP